MAGFKMLSRLQPDSATMVGLLTAAGVYLIYNNSLPTMADIRLGPPNDNDVEAARRGAAVKSAVLIGLVFLVARDLNSYIISGGALVGIDYMYKHHNAIEPSTGKLDVGTPPTIAPGAGAPMQATESYGG
jgi:hypothetical protein